MIKLLIGGSPCTYWSIAQNKDKREKEARGIGWELFKNYVIAKEKFQPNYFLYENNWSASKEIKEQIQEELDCKLMRINSNLVSAQNRDRFYVFNWNVKQPEDKGILLKDILEDNVSEKLFYDNSLVEYNGNFPQCAKLNINGHDILKRVYSIDSKSPTLTTCGGGHTEAKIYINNRVRKLSTIEYERLQTMPDNYTACVSNTQRYKGLGNGWTAEVIIHILNGILKDVPKDEKILVLSMYDGIGTGRYCLDKMGFTNVKYYAYEIDKWAIQVALNNYPDIIECGDAFDIRKEDWSLPK
jgi:DNA (cytosine-5)-methyltransferase 3A